MSNPLETFYSDTEVLSQSGADALVWYQAVQVGERRTRKDFDWLGFAKGAALRARITEEGESLAWSTVSTAVFRQLTQDDPEGGHDLGEMYCRVATIEKHGAIAEDGLRDPETIFAWFRENAAVSSVEETQKLVDRLMDELTDEFVEQVVAPLRRLKTRMTVIRALPDDCPIPVDISGFLRLYHQLP